MSDGPGTPRDEARALLARMTDRRFVGEWSAPGRVNLIGEHTDYNNGFVLPFAIGSRTHVALADRDDNAIRVASTFDEEIVNVALGDLAEVFPGQRSHIPEWAAYPLGVAWALHRTAPDARAHGVDIAITSDVPIGAGLSSSAAIESAVAIALNDVWGAGITPAALADIGRTAENDAVGAPTGIMDQMASMLGREDAALFLDCRSLAYELVPLGFVDAGLGVLVIDTRVSHSHATGGYGDRRAACERGAATLDAASLREVDVSDLPRAAALLDHVTFRRVRHVVTENARVEQTVAALHAGGPTTIGPLLTASHISMRDDFEISTPELDLAVATALEAGALGARMTGGGFGGSAIALVPRAQASAVSDAVTAAFEAAGFTTPRVFPVDPSPGARRD